MEQLLKIVNTILENRGRATVSSLTPETLLRDDLGFDSLDLAELTVKVEAEFDVDIFEDGLITTIGEILDKIG